MRETRVHACLGSSFAPRAAVCVSACVRERVQRCELSLLSGTVSEPCAAPVSRVAVGERDGPGASHTRRKQRPGSPSLSPSAWQGFSF